MRVLVTGGYGCIGAWILRDLLAHGHQAWVFDLERQLKRVELVLQPADLARVGFVAGDVSDPAALERAIATHSIDHVIHLAGLQVPTCRANPILGARVNVLGTIAVFEAARAHKGQVRRVVYASSAAVHGPPEPRATGPVPDRTLLEPMTHYGVFKVCNEGNARVYWQEHGIPSVGLRPWTVYGVGRDQGLTSAPTKAIKAVVLGRRAHIPFGGWQDLQYVADVAGTFRRCLEVDLPGARAYNLRGDVTQVADFCRTLAEVEPAAADLVTHGTDQLPISYDLDDAQLQRDVGGLPRTSLAGGVAETLQIFRQLHAAGNLDASDLEPAPSRAGAP